MKEQLKHIKMIYHYTLVPLQTCDLPLKMIDKSQQQQSLQQQESSEWESNLIGQRRIQNPMMVEYQIWKEKCVPMSIPISMVGKVHYGQNL
jgi:hypothetical protein